MGFSTLKVTLTNCYQNVLLFLTFNSQFHQILCTIPDSAYILNLSQISAPFPILQFPNYFELVMAILIMVIMLVMLVMVVMVVIR